jgi:cobyrinic acid a,c-diamide synthase
MGMFDGDNCTAKLAAHLGTPVVLVVDAYGAAESVAATVRGFYETGVEDFGVEFAGVIINRVASKTHFERIEQSINDMLNKQAQNIPVLGLLTREQQFEITQRHLGLVIAEESPIDEDALAALSQAVLQNIKVERIYESAALSKDPIDGFMPVIDVGGLDGSSKKIAVAYDKAFCFYYQDTLDVLKEDGIEIVYFSPLTDANIPAGVAAVYLGGGYPELYAKELSENRSMIESIRKWAEDGKPLYGECGGLMYLSSQITDLDDNRFAMTGVFPFSTRMLKRPRLGYREVKLKEDCLIGDCGLVYRGHEYHYSEIENKAVFETGESNCDICSIYEVTDSKGRILKETGGYRYKNTLASYVHIHFRGSQIFSSTL